MTEQNKNNASAENPPSNFQQEIETDEKKSLRFGTILLLVLLIALVTFYCLGHLSGGFPAKPPAPGSDGITHGQRLLQGSGRVQKNSYSGRGLCHCRTARG